MKSTTVDLYEVFSTQHSKQAALPFPAPHFSVRRQCLAPMHTRAIVEAMFCFFLACLSVHFVRASRFFFVAARAAFALPLRARGKSSLFFNKESHLPSPSLRIFDFRPEAAGTTARVSVALQVTCQKLPWIRAPTPPGSEIYDGSTRSRTNGQNSACLFLFAKATSFVCCCCSRRGETPMQQSRPDHEEIHPKNGTTVERGRGASEWVLPR